MKKQLRRFGWGKVLFLAVLALVLGGNVYLLNNKDKLLNKSKAKANYPITGTFIMTDMNFSDPRSGYKKLLTDMQSVGIDTMVELASGLLVPNQNGTYEEQVWAGSKDLDAINSAAYELGMKVFIGAAAPSWNTDVHFTTEEQSKLLDLSLRSIEAMKQHYDQTLGSSFWENNVIGFYGDIEFDIRGGPKNYLANLSRELKAKYPGKKVLFSPYKRETITYERAYKAFDELFATGIDILAPQDGIGALLVTTMESNTQQFKALADVIKNKYPDRQGWANVETFKMSNIKNSSTAKPTDIGTLVGQINSSKPYVSKQITWIFQHNLATIPELDSMNSWTNQYTPENAEKRKKLRQDYEAVYGPNGSGNLVKSTPKPRNRPSRLRFSIPWKSKSDF